MCLTDAQANAVRLERCLGGGEEQGTPRGEGGGGGRMGEGGRRMGRGMYVGTEGAVCFVLRAGGGEFRAARLFNCAQRTSIDRAVIETSITSICQYGTLCGNTGYCKNKH